MPGQQRDDALAHGRQVAGEQRVVFGEAAAARHRRGEHPGLVAFGQGHGGVPGAVTVDGGADDEGRPNAGVQPVAHLRQQRGVGPDALADLARRHRVGQHAPVVGRDRHQHRAAGRRHGHVPGAGDGQRHVFGAGGLDAPLDIGLGQLGGLGRVQEGVERQDRPRLLAGGDDQRRAVLEGREDVAHRMADAGGRMQVDEGRGARGLRVPVGHADHHRLLQAQHIGEVGWKVEEQRQLGRAGVAEHRGHAALAHQPVHGLPDGDAVSGGGGGHANLQTAVVGWPKCRLPLEMEPSSEVWWRCWALCGPRLRCLSDRAGQGRAGLFCSMSPGPPALLLLLAQNRPTLPGAQPPPRHAPRAVSVAGRGQWVTGRRR